MRTRLIFVRHAEAEGNINRRFQGWTDGDLTEKGHKQAELCADKLKNLPIDMIYSSSLQRTLKTAEQISRVKNLPVIRTDKLKEINGGDWEDVPWSVLPERWPEQYHSWENMPHMHRMPNGETMEEFRDRVLDEVMHIINQNKGKNICIVTHGTAIKALMCSFHHCALDQMLNVPWYDNTSITVIDYEDGKFTSVVEGDNSHLGREMSTIENQDWWEEYSKSVKS